MRKIVLHSEQVAGSEKVEEAFLKFFDGGKPKVGYIPSQSDDEDRTWFKKKCEWYAQFGITDMFYFDIDQEYKEDELDELLSCDAIFLSGGDTYHFLNSLKRRRFLQVLRDYVERGGVLTGVSAGSIIMTPTIEVCALHDENTTDLEDFSSLSLVDFEFFPHLNDNEEEYMADLVESSKNNKLIYACRDGEGIIVNGDEMQFIGDVVKVENGSISAAQ